MTIQAFYARQDLLTDPGELAGGYDDLPGTISGMREVVSGLIVHVAWAERYGIPPDVPMVRQTQPVADRLRLIQASFAGSLTVPRPPRRRTFGTCRDYALLLCSMLRNRSIPARVRCGFAAYLAADMYHDHWICEYWSPVDRRWVQVDAQLDQFQIDQSRIEFDCSDLPRDAFLTASQAWRLARSNAIAAESFGHEAATGLWFLRVNVYRDLLSLTNRQMSAWDSWRDAAPASKVLDVSTLAELDRLADMVTPFEGGSDQFAALDEAASRNVMPPWFT
ncbi:transglutaminase-like domain-containing protein [Bradyrhizobium septentrionale]|uniref:Transglutaminase domain-containing protein n=1 Tax=Bradyrhizobium septentrionale TaxID=1404411 RepID=A0A974A4B5_9BRAD|nr:transglutaminase-like domain-containing protein [Bradyrhizobium septentrionale]UGY15882.1 transglutaminase-like domain-containing protein [Bradyrhizobium septentrionale]UGY24457.1 transglutaminase-like domain-containing protein [Bradyrhizobium septentrionale]